MTREQAVELVNESLIDQDTKFTREINALFKTQDVVDLLQQAYDIADDNAKMSLMDATEKQFLDKFAKDGGSGDDDTKKKDDEETTDDDLGFEADGSDLDDFEDEGGSDDFGSENDFETEPSEDNTSNDFGGEESNPFADFGGGEESTEETPAEPSNPFESHRPNYRNSLNESNKRRFIRRKKF